MKKISMNIAHTMLLFSVVIIFCIEAHAQSTIAAVQNKYDYDSIIINRPEKTKALASTNDVVEEEKIVTAIPEPVKSNFNATYPSATDIIWSKETIVSKNASYVTIYKANFVSNDKSNWVIYSENGSVIEKREQINPEQLPANVLKSIKQKYPDSDIVLSTTYKHVKQHGSYYVVIVPLTGAEKKEIELILKENGNIVQ